MAKDLKRADLMRVSLLIEPAGVHDAERQEGLGAWGARLLSRNCRPCVRCRNAMP
ncbi:hypothetical protein ABVB18_04990 [Xanthomonas citri pv. mangiferaeindicae]|uniref:hypothetical protein n=1 Tax=Xanthomonas citri TaxID=346 RepID=UPI0002552436|nr:hypothetical protein [Xanthomonas citri]UDB88660.1 hypothetical protein LCZ91_01120 [Xanthomonas citri pv. mangiferaeindicae]CCG35798.1 hypothetical protein XMIN_757 [Xanthomonas citri pv. mangiferaeindicae LMG 941]